MGLFLTCREMNLGTQVHHLLPFWLNCLSLRRFTDSNNRIRVLVQTDFTERENNKFDSTRRVLLYPPTCFSDNVTFSSVLTTSLRCLFTSMCKSSKFSHKSTAEWILK